MASRLSGTNDSTIWANAGAITDPGLSKINTGWIVEAPPHQTQNWWQDKVDRWLAYLDSLGGIQQADDLAALKAINTTGLSNTGNTFSIINKFGMYQLLNGTGQIDDGEFIIIPTTGTANDYWQLLIPHADAIFAYIESAISDLQEQINDRLNVELLIPPIVDNTITVTTVIWH